MEYMDTTEYLAVEKKRQQEKETRKRVTQQVLILLIAGTKLYLISLIQGSMTLYNPAFGQVSIFLKMTFTFGLMIIGNVVDNVS